MCVRMYLCMYVEESMDERTARWTNEQKYLYSNVLINFNKMFHYSIQLGVCHTLIHQRLLPLAENLAAKLNVVFPSGKLAEVRYWPRDLQG